MKTHNALRALDIFYILDGIVILCALFLLWYVPVIPLSFVSYVEAKKNDPVNTVLFMPNNQSLVTMLQGGDVLIHSVPDGKTLFRLNIGDLEFAPVDPPLNGSCFAVDASSQCLAVSGLDGTIYIVDVNAKKLIRKWKQPKLTERIVRNKGEFSLAASSLDISLHGKRLSISYQEGVVYVVELSTGEVLKEMKFDDEVSFVKFLGDRKSLLVVERSSAPTVHLVHMDNWRSQQINCSSLVGELTVIAVSKDNRMVALGDTYGNIEVWEIEQQNLLAKLDYQHPVDALDFSYDGNLLAAGSCQMAGVQVWDVKRGRSITRFSEMAIWTPIYPLFNLDFSFPHFLPDHRLLLTWTENATIRIRYARSGRVGRVIYSPAGGDYQTYAHSQDGQWLALGRSDGIVELWRFE